MKFFCISDNIDTKVGMRLAGIKTVVVHKKDEIEKALDQILKDKQIAIVLITEKLRVLCEEKVNKIKTNSKSPLIVFIPDRHGNPAASDGIEKYLTGLLA